MRPHLGKTRPIWTICMKSGQKCSRIVKKIQSCGPSILPLSWQQSSKAHCVKLLLAIEHSVFLQPPGSLNSNTIVSLTVHCSVHYGHDPLPTWFRVELWKTFCWCLWLKQWPAASSGLYFLLTLSQEVQDREPAAECERLWGLVCWASGVWRYVFLQLPCTYSNLSTSQTPTPTPQTLWWSCVGAASTAAPRRAAALEQRWSVAGPVCRQHADALEQLWGCMGNVMGLCGRLCISAGAACSGKGTARVDSWVVAAASRVIVDGYSCWCTWFCTYLCAGFPVHHLTISVFCPYLCSSFGTCPGCWGTWSYPCGRRLFMTSVVCITVKLHF